VRDGKIVEWYRIPDNPDTPNDPAPSSPDQPPEVRGGPII